MSTVLISKNPKALAAIVSVNTTKLRSYSVFWTYYCRLGLMMVLTTTVAKLTCPPASCMMFSTQVGSIVLLHFDTVTVI